MSENSEEKKKVDPKVQEEMDRQIALLFSKSTIREQVDNDML